MRHRLNNLVQRLFPPLLGSWSHVQKEIENRSCFIFRQLYRGYPNVSANLWNTTVIISEAWTYLQATSCLVLIVYKHVEHSSFTRNTTPRPPIGMLTFRFLIVQMFDFANIFVMLLPFRQQVFRRYMIFTRLHVRELKLLLASSICDQGISILLETQMASTTIVAPKDRTRDVSGFSPCQCC